MHIPIYFKKVFLSTFLLVTIVNFASIPSNAKAASLTADSGGQLTGANSLRSQDGKIIYHLEFKEGTCADIFEGCDGREDFSYDRYTYAYTEFVFYGILLGDTTYSSNPNEILGCEDSLTCEILNPYNITSSGEVEFYRVSINADGSKIGSFGSLPSSYDTKNDPLRTWAAWTPVVVPLPATFPMLAFGLGILSWFGRRKHKQQVMSIPN